MEKLKKPLKDRIGFSKEHRKREFEALMSQIRCVRLIDYEDSIVLARTILDAADEEDLGHIASRPHILIALTRNGSVEVERKGQDTVCFVTVSKYPGRQQIVDEGSCKVHDPSGAIYEAAAAGISYVVGLYDEFYKR